MSYNRLFETFVDNQPSKILGYVAYGLYKESKRQWVQQETSTRGVAPTDTQIRGHVGSYTPALQDSLLKSAETALAAFAAEAIEEAKPAIVQEALRGSAASAIRIGLLTNLIYTVLLVALAIVLKYAGVDILGIFQSTKG